MVQERRDSGEFVETVTTEHVREVVRDHSDPVVTTSDVATALDCSTEAARRKLQELHEEDEVSRKSVGARAVVWWLSDADSEPNPVNPDDPFFTSKGIFASGKGDLSQNVDEYLYGAESPQ